MLALLADVLLNKDQVEAIYVGNIEYGKCNPYFLVAIRNTDGSTIAAYVEQATSHELKNVHERLAGYVTVGEWTNISLFGDFGPLKFGATN